MAESSKQLAGRLQEVLLDGTWIAYTNYKHAIENITWKLATEKVSSLNTIAALTFHINYYLSGVLKVFNGGVLEIRDKYSFDCPEITSEEDWENLKNDFIDNAKQFVSHVLKLPEATLESAFVDEKYGNYRRNIEGMIEHAYYHLGQISLIKKLAKEQ